MAYQIKSSASIVVGGSVSNPITLNENTVAGITAGSSLTATTLTFLVSMDNVNYYSLYDNTSTEVSLTLVSGSSRAYALSASSFFPWNFVKLREGNSASAVNQATVDAVFGVSLKKL